MRRLLTFVVVLGFAAALLARLARTQNTGAAANVVTVYIVQRDKAAPLTWGFDKMSITVPPGTTVAWKSVAGNRDRHTSTSYDGVWNSPFLNPGDQWAFTFSKVGRYRYHCTPHPWMVGVVNVVAGAPVPPPIPRVPK